MFGQKGTRAVVVENGFMKRTIRRKQIRQVCLGLFFSFGVTLSTWDKGGMLNREISYYRALLKRLGKVVFITYDRPGRATDAMLRKIRPIVVIFNKWWIPTRVYGLLAPLIHARVLMNCDIIKTNQLSGAWVAALASRLFKKPLVVRCGYVTSRFAVFSNAGFLSVGKAKLFEGFALRRAKVVFTASNSDKNYISRTFQISKKSIKVVPNAIDTELFKPDQKIKAIPGRILYIGRLSKQKNLDSLVGAFARLDRGELCLVGAGPLEGKIREQSEKMNIRFLGMIPNRKLAGLLNTAEIFVLPSLYEGTPKTLLEAMATSRAVIGTNVPGTREVIKHRINGLLCKPTANSLFHSIQELQSSKQLRSQIGQEARKHILKNYAQTSVVQKEMASLQGVLRPQRPLPRS